MNVLHDETQPEGHNIHKKEKVRKFEVFLYILPSSGKSGNLPTCVLAFHPPATPERAVCFRETWRRRGDSNHEGRGRRRQSEQEKGKPEGARKKGRWSEKNVRQFCKPVTH